VSRVVLVTGAAGAIGGPVLAALAASGWRTRALVHRRTVEAADETAAGALEQPGSLRAAAAGADAVLHLAAVTHARRDRDYRRANVDGTRNMLEAAAAAGVRRFVHVSTRAVSREGGGYSRSKLDAEALVEEAGVEHSIVRLPEVYGAGGSEGVDDVLARASRGAPIPIVAPGRDLLCPVHVDDAAAALAAALAAPEAAGTTYTLAGECVTARELAERCAAIAGGGSRVVAVPGVAVALAARAARVLPLPLYPDQLARLRAPKPASSPAARRDLGFDPRPLEAGLAAVLRPAGR
jgi:2-alkyl-3-oxoalkanoate reductase